MNEIDVEDILGVINFVTCSRDFFEDYSEIDTINVYSYEGIDNTPCAGLIITPEDTDLSVSVPISLRSFLNIKMYMDVQTKSLATPENLLNFISNNYDISFPMAFIKDVYDDYFETYLLFGKDEKYMCVNSFLSDIFCLRNIMDIPVFINKEIIRKRGFYYEEVKKNL